MRRFLVVLLVLASLLLSVAQWWAAGRVQAHYEQLVERLGRVGVQVGRSDYRRGLWWSSAHTDLLLRPLRLRARTRIEHALPLTWVGGGASLRTRLSRVLPDGSEVPFAMQLHARWAALPSGAIRTQLRAEGAAAGVWHGVFEHGPGGARVSGRLHVSALQWPLADQERLSVSDLRLAVDLTPGPGGWPWGSARLSIGQAEAFVADPLKALRLSGLRIRLLSDPRSEGARLRVNGSAAEYRSQPVSFNAAQLRAVVQGLPPEVITATVKALLGFGAVTAEQRWLYAGTDLLRGLIKVAEARPRLDVDRFAFETPHGSVTANGAIALEGFRAEEAWNLRHWFESIESRGRVEIPLAWLEERLAGPASASSGGSPLASWFVRREGRLSSQWTLRAGMLRVNGGERRLFGH